MIGFDVSTALATAKMLFAVAKDANRLEAQQQAIDLQRQLMELWQEHVALQEEVAGLREAARLKEVLEFDGGAYWYGADRTEKGGPLCTRCKDVDQRAVRMTRYGKGFARCPECESNLDTRPDRAVGRARTEYDPFAE